MKAAGFRFFRTFSVPELTAVNTSEETEKKRDRERDRVMCLGKQLLCFECMIYLYVHTSEITLANPPFLPSAGPVCSVPVC